jgi:transposase InsO family protein
MSRQNYYATRRQRQRRTVDEELVMELVKRERRSQPRLGTRKLLHMLQGDLEEAAVRIGRDRLFELLRDNGLLVERKRGRARTTNSRHSLPVFITLVAGRKPDGPNQAWASDLTYLRTEGGFMYAAVITDMHSRKIVGSYVGDSLEAEGCIPERFHSQAGRLSQRTPRVAALAAVDPARPVVDRHCRAGESTQGNR